MSESSEHGRNDEPVLLCFDGSTAARRAVILAAPLLGDRRAVVLDVAPLQMVAGDYVALDPDAAELDEVNSADALARARTGAELARDAGFRAEARADLETRAWKGIVDVADEIDGALIVVGSRGPNGLRELFEGSVPRDIAERAGRPLLIVPPLRLSSDACADRAAVPETS
jgi:nucleotide-binding universal stress UspA family protein